MKVTIIVGNIEARSIDLPDDLGDDPRALRDVATGAVTREFYQAWMSAAGTEPPRHTHAYQPMPGQPVCQYPICPVACSPHDPVHRPAR